MKKNSPQKTSITPQRILGSSLLCALLLSAFGAATAATTATDGTRQEIGNADVLIRSLGAQHANPNASFLRSTDTSSAKNKHLDTDITDYHFKDGLVSVSGKARGSANSHFYLKATW